MLPGRGKAGPSSDSLAAKYLDPSSLVSTWPRRTRSWARPSMPTIGLVSETCMARLISSTEILDKPLAVRGVRVRSRMGYGHLRLAEQHTIYSERLQVRYATEKPLFHHFEGRHSETFTPSNLCRWAATSVRRTTDEMKALQTRLTPLLSPSSQYFQ